MMEEIGLAIKELKRNKAPGIDNLNYKLLIALEGSGKQLLCNIITNSYETNKWGAWRLQMRNDTYTKEEKCEE